MTILLSLALALITVKPENGRFTIYQDGKAIGVEQFSISTIPGGYRATGEMRLDGESAPMKSRMDLDQDLNPTSYEYEDSRGVVRVKIDSPLSDYEQVVNGQSSSETIEFPKGGFILENLFHHYLLLLYKVAAGPESLPIFTPQSLGVGLATIQKTGKTTFSLDIKGAKMEATTDADGRMIRLAVPDAKLVVER